MASPKLDAQGLEASVSSLKGVGPKLEIMLHKAGIFQVKDLLFHLPLRYLDRTKITPIGALQPYSYVVIQGEIQASDIIFGRRRSLMVKLADGTGVSTLRFFHFSNAQKTSLSRGKFLRCAGEVRPGRAGLEFYHPEYEFVEEDAAPPQPELTPIYSTTDGLTQARLRDLTSQAIKQLKNASLEELLPEYSGQASLRKALLYLHRPPVDADVNLLTAGSHPFQKQIVFEELVAHQLSMQIARAKTKAKSAPRLIFQEKISAEFNANLAFELTGAQQRVISEIQQDLISGAPMLRLLQGDVGSGKTLVAASAVISALGNGFQAAVMVPTEILAEQHLESFENWLNPLGFKVVFLSGKTKGKAREAILDMISSGKADLVVGTHALFQKDVDFANLGLLVIDEQHRFGVHQRMALGEKGQKNGLHPHQLIMTATPIPRTLAMSHYSDLDASVIDELPPGRKAVTTVALPSIRRQEVVAKVEQACAEGRQVYWVCTLIEESEELQAQAAEAVANELSMILNQWQVSLIHGRMKPKEKASVMESFRSGDTHVLVSTTVIEVGVDVPNASLMVIENPERLGLSQLHQLRGRVGRGSAESHCLLLYEPPLTDSGTQRINAMRQTNDGFQIADIDLKLRGPGELLGARQAGDIGFLLADLQRDSELLETANEAAKKLCSEDSERVNKLLARWTANSMSYLDA